MTVYQDLFNLKEDERIELIGHYVTEHNKTTAFYVEDDEKADRYVKKLTEKFPMLEVVGRFPGPANTVCVKLKKREQA